MKPEHDKLNMGCGYRKLEGYWNVDRDDTCHPDEVLDFNQLPWPYEDNSFTKIQASLVLQYLSPDNEIFMSIIKEMARISSNQAEWIIAVPHHRCDFAYDDFMQTRRITAKGFELFDQKKNFETVAKKTGHSTYGFANAIDLELTDMQHNLVPYWKQQLENGMIGQSAMEVEAMTKNNVIDVVTLILKVHKPGRFQDWIPSQKKS